MTAIEMPIKTVNMYKPVKPVKVLAINAIDKVVIAHLIMRLLEPSFATCFIKILVPAKQIIGMPARSATAELLMSKYSFSIGISGPIKTKPARILRDAKNIGIPFASFDFNYSGFATA